MAAPYTVPLPPDLVLWDGCIIRVTAVDPATGNLVSGVTVSDVAIECDQLTGPRVGVDNPLLLGVSL
jgi:hypothetical protein